VVRLDKTFSRQIVIIESNYKIWDMLLRVETDIEDNAGRVRGALVGAMADMMWYEANRL
jgi:hypothetical protein